MYLALILNLCTYKKQYRNKIEKNNSNRLA